MIQEVLSVVLRKTKAKPKTAGLSCGVVQGWLSALTHMVAFAVVVALGRCLKIQLVRSPLATTVKPLWGAVSGWGIMGLLGNYVARLFDL